MTRSELVDKLMHRMSGKSRHDVEKIVAVLFEEIAHALERGQRVELRGFGSFSVKTRSERVGCDPRSGKAISVDERFIPYFRAGKILLERLN